MRNTFLNDILNSITKVLRDYTNQKKIVYVKDRAVSIGAVFQAMQNQLMGGENDSGDMIEPVGYVLDVYVDDVGTFCIATKQDGKLYKYPVAVDAKSNITFGAEQEVAMDFAPVTQSRQVTVKRQDDGSIRWFAMPACVSVLNRSGEIDSRALFDSFIEHINRTGLYPELDFYHMGEDIVLGRADWVGRDDAAYCASGLFYDTPIARAAAKSLEDNPDYWGLSIAYVSTEAPSLIRSSEGIEIPVYDVGINRFISILPEKTAASILTAISTKEVNRMKKDVQEALKKLIGNDETLLNEIVNKVDSINREATNMISREATPAPANPAPAATPAPAKDAKEEVGRELTDADVTMIIGTDAFKGAVREIVVATLAEQQQANQVETPDAPVPTAPTAPAAPVSDASAQLLETVKQLQRAVEDLADDKKGELDDVLNDLPSRIARTQVVRPRATRMPESLLKNRQAPDLAAIAEQTLAEMGENT